MHVWDGDPAVERIVLPDRGRGEALVALAAASVAHIDLTVASGTFASVRSCRLMGVMTANDPRTAASRRGVFDLDADRVAVVIDAIAAPIEQLRSAARNYPTQRSS